VKKLPNYWANLGESMSHRYRRIAEIQLSGVDVGAMHRDSWALKPRRRSDLLNTRHSDLQGDLCENLPGSRGKAKSLQDSEGQEMGN